MLTFGDNKSFPLYGDLLKTMTIYDFIVDQSNPQDRKIISEFGKKVKFNIEHKRRKNPRDESVMRLLKYPAVMASRISTVFLPAKPKELCEKIKIVLEEK